MVSLAGGHTQALPVLLAPCPLGLPWVNTPCSLGGSEADAPASRPFSSFSRAWQPSRRPPWPVCQEPARQQQSPNGMWLSAVLADLWNLGGENYSTKASSICNQPKETTKRRFYELQTGAVPTATARSPHATHHWEGCLCPLFLNIPVFRWL